MARQPWSAAELDTLVALGPNDWAGFHEAHPARSYDSWEVKRRRFIGTAGTRPIRTAPPLLVYRAEQALRTLTRLVEAVR